MPWSMNFVLLLDKISHTCISSIFFDYRKHLLLSNHIMTKELLDALGVKAVSLCFCIFFLQYMIDGYLIYTSYTSFPISLFIFFFGRGWAWCCLVLARERKATWVPSLHTVLCGECSLSLELISLGVSNCFSMENQILETGGWVEVIDLHGKWDNQAKPICTTEIYARENDGIKHH